MRWIFFVFLAFLCSHGILWGYSDEPPIQKQVQITTDGIREVYLFANKAFKQGDYPTVINMLKPLQNKHLLFAGLLGSAYYMDGQYSKSLDVWSQLSERDPNVQQIIMIKAMCYRGLMQYDKALEEADKVIAEPCDVETIIQYELLITQILMETDIIKDLEAESDVLLPDKIELSHKGLLVWAHEGRLALQQCSDIQLLTDKQQYNMSFSRIFLLREYLVGICLGSSKQSPDAELVELYSERGISPASSSDEDLLLFLTEQVLKDYDHHVEQWPGILEYLPSDKFYSPILKIRRSIFKNRGQRDLILSDICRFVRLLQKSGGQGKILPAPDMDVDLE